MHIHFILIYTINFQIITVKVTFAAGAELGVAAPDLNVKLANLSGRNLSIGIN